MIVDVFVKVWADGAMRQNLARAVIARLFMFGPDKIRPVLLCADGRDFRNVNDLLPRAEMSRWTWAWQIVGRDRFWVTSKQYAEDHAESPVYVVIDDDHLPIGKTWLDDGVAALEAHPEFAMLSSWSINGEVPGPPPGFTDPVGPDSKFPYCDDDVFEIKSSTGTPYFTRRGVLGQLPEGDDGGAATYDGILSAHVLKQGRIGFLRDVRHNHLGCGYSQVVSGHWSA